MWKKQLFFAEIQVECFQTQLLITKIILSTSWIFLEKKNLLNTIPWQNVEIIWSANCSAWQTRDTEVILRGLNSSMVPVVPTITTDNRQVNNKSHQTLNRPFKISISHVNENHFNSYTLLVTDVVIEKDFSNNIVKLPVRTLFLDRL